MPDVDKEVTVGTIHENNLGMVDFNSICLEIGAVPLKRFSEHPRWMELDEDDWKILSLLLHKPLVGNSSAMSESEGLRRFGEFADAIVEWYRRNKENKP